MEHFIGDDLRQELGQVLTEPKHDPHGREIPTPPE
jgi:Mn-dependent DtxR family transcriptional regulator